jgi:hypothetical protein
MNNDPAPEYTYEEVVKLFNPHDFTGVVKFVKAVNYMKVQAELQSVLLANRMLMERDSLKSDLTAQLVEAKILLKEIANLKVEPSQISPLHGAGMAEGFKIAATIAKKGL